MPIEFLVLGGVWVLGWGGSAKFICMGAAIYLTHTHAHKHSGSEHSRHGTV